MSGRRRPGWPSAARLVAGLRVCVRARLRASSHAQTRFSYSSGQSLEPAYEGWWENPDGSFTLFFGYMNTNWLQEFDIPVGPNNRFEPGNPDVGQPTHFYPRRNPFLFTIQVPKDFGTKEITWTLTANGQTRTTYASLKTDYLIDKQVISTEVGGDNGSLADALRTNEPPDLAVEGPKTRTVKVGEPLALAVIAGDPDNLPARRDGKPQPGMKVAAKPAGEGRGRGAVAPQNSAAVVYRPPVAVTASSGPGLRFAWSVYRGQGVGRDVQAGPDEDVDGHARLRATPVGLRRTSCRIRPLMAAGRPTSSSASLARMCCARWRATARSSPTRTSRSPVTVAGATRERVCACGHAEPRPSTAAAKASRQFALGVGPQRQ